MFTYLYGGSTQVFKNRDLITGFVSDLSNKICNPFTASTIQGDAIYYNPIVTPSITNYMGPLSQQTFTVYTGKPIPTPSGAEYEYPAGQILAQNGVDAPSRVITVWNGFELVTTYDFLSNRTAFKDEPSFDGMQNAPVFSGNITNETSSYIYDANNLRTIGLIY